MMKKSIVHIFCGLLAVALLLCGATAKAQAPEFAVASAANVTTPTVVLPVTVKKFNQFLALQGSLNWDNSKLTYKSMTTPAAPLSNMQFNQSVSGSTGRLSFLWVDNNLQTQTLPDNTVLFSITFNVVPGSTGSTGINFTNNPTSLLVSDANMVAVPNVVYNGATVSFPGNALPPEFTIGSLVNVTSTTVSLPITTKNFLQYLGWQGSINWENGKLSFNSVSAPASVVSGMQFSSSVAGNTGKISFIWTENNLNPVTIPDNTVLFTLVLNVVPGSTGITELNFTNSPTPLLLSDANSRAADSVIYNKGTVAFPGAGVSPELMAGSLFNVIDSTVDIPVRCKDFSQILAMQGSINWDNSKLLYTGVSAPAAQLSGMLFNPSVSEGTGRLGYLWTDNNLTPQSLADSLVLFTISFKVTGGNTGFTPISFTGAPTPQLLSNAAGKAVSNVIYTNGKVTFTRNICPGGSTSITSSLTGISYQWQEDSTNGYQNISDDAYRSGTNTPFLSLNNLPSKFNQYKYRCMVNGISSIPFTLKFNNYWIGTKNAAWEDPANWSCGMVPDNNTNVILTNGTPFNLKLNTDATIKSITIKSPATITIANGVNLVIKEN